MSLAEQVGNETPDLEDVIQGFIRMNQLELNTCLPGQITDYDALTQTCSVQPLIARTLLNGSVFSRQEIDEVPVVFPRSKTGGITFPLASGDGVMIIFGQRSIENWSFTGLEGASGDTRLHDINDAIVVPGLFSLAGSMIPPQVEATEVRGEKIFVGDPLQFTSPINVIIGPLVGGADAGGKAPVVIPPGQLDLVGILSIFMDLMLNSGYGIGPPGMTGGGGYMDASTTAALTGLKADLLKLKP